MKKLESRRWLALTVIATLAIRVAALQLGWSSLSTDPDSYGRLAVALAATGTYGFPAENRGSDSVVQPTAYRPPLYPMILSLAVRNGRLDLISVAAIHVLLGMGTTVCVLQIAVRLRMRWPGIPALAVACDPILLRGSQLLMTETLVTFLAVSIWLVWLAFVRPESREGDSHWQRRRLANCWAAVLGLLLGASVLTRPTMLPWVISLIVLLGLRRSSGNRRLPVVALCILTTSMWVLPWTLRNNRYLGVPILTTTHSGYTLLLANNPLLYGYFRAKGNDRNWDANDFHQRWAGRREGDPTQESFWSVKLPTTTLEPAIQELVDDRLATQVAIATIRSNLNMFAISCLYRASWFWAVAPNEGPVEVRVAIGLWYGLWFLFCAVGAFKIGVDWKSRVWLAPAILVMSLTLIHVIFWSNMRMRAPIMPMVYVAATMGLFGCRHTLVPIPLRPQIKDLDND